MSSNTAFRKLLKSESSAALPATEDAVVELFDLYVVRPEARPERGSRNSKPTPERLELAAAILWFNTHVSDPVAALVRLSFEMQEKLAECFVKVLPPLRAIRNGSPATSNLRPPPAPPLRSARRSLHGGGPVRESHLSPPPPSQGVSRPAARREQHQTSVSIRAFLSASPMTRTV